MGGLTHLKSFDREQLFEDQPKDYLFRCQPINQWFEMCQAEKMKVLVASSGFPSKHGQSCMHRKYTIFTCPG